MKLRHPSSSAIKRALSIYLLCFIRDRRPTETALLSWLGEKGHSRYHDLRKTLLLVSNEGRVCISSDRLSKDGKCFRFENQIYDLERKIIHTFKK